MKFSAIPPAGGPYKQQKYFRRSLLSSHCLSGRHCHRFPFRELIYALSKQEKPLATGLLFGSDSSHRESGCIHQDHAR
ncbi:unnamed protein product [Protopolystoma xenopodis]|uniref:Uncharacterized protein n=1 Tax=Protopolystoma xenopodis TaxID=117903 RepID=A0A3S5C2Z7_9PLAT|nr:unnamed protein product [Protopolystoma xenopodis]